MFGSQICMGKSDGENMRGKKKKEKKKMEEKLENFQENCFELFYS